MTDAGYHILRRDGDGTREVDQAIARIGSAESAGLHRHFFVSRANQTVVMADGPDALIAAALRELGGWDEPIDSDA